MSSSKTGEVRRDENTSIVGSRSAVGEIFRFPEAAVVCGDGDYGGLSLSLPDDRAKADGSGGWTDCWTGNESVETRGSAAIGMLLQGIGWDAKKGTHG